MPSSVEAMLESWVGVWGVCGYVKVWRVALAWCGVFGWNIIAIRLRERSYLYEISSFSFWRLSSIGHHNLVLYPCFLWWNSLIPYALPLIGFDFFMLCILFYLLSFSHCILVCLFNFLMNWTCHKKENKKKDNSWVEASFTCKSSYSSTLQNLRMSFF